MRRTIQTMNTQKTYNSQTTNNTYRGLIQGDEIGDTLLAPMSESDSKLLNEEIVRGGSLKFVNNMAFEGIFIS